MQTITREEIRRREAEYAAKSGSGQQQQPGSQATPTISREEIARRTSSAQTPAYNPPSSSGWSIRNVADFAKEKLGQSLDRFTQGAKFAASVAKPIAETAIQFPRAVASGVAGLSGHEQAAQDLAKPITVPLLGEVKPLSAVPGEASALAMAGQAAEMGSLVVGGSGVAATGKQAIKGVAKKAIVEGAISGAESGALSGFGQKAQEQDATVTDSLASGLKSAALGGALGAAAGGVAANTSKAGKMISSEKKLSEMVSPELSKAEKATAITAGRGAEEGILGSAKVLPTNRNKEVMNAVRDVVNPKEGLIQNVNRVREANFKEAEALKVAVGESKAIYNPNELKKALRSVEKPPMLIADAKQASLYQQAEKKFLEFANKEGGTPAGLLEARKKFDGWIEENIPKIWEDQSVRPLHRALRDMRTSANTFLADRLPGVAFKDSLKKQSLMYEAIDNMSEKAVKDIGTNKVTRFVKKHPMVREAAKYAAGAAGATSLYQVGKSIEGN